MRYETKQKWRRFFDSVFDVFAQKFRHRIVIGSLVFLEFVIVEGLIYLNLSQTKNTDALSYLILRCLLLFSVLFFSCGHVACRSYNNCKKQQADGASKYRRRTIENSLVGLGFFLMSFGLLLFMVLKKISY